MIYALLLYAVWCTLLYFFQDQVIFPRHFLSLHQNKPIPNSVEQVWIEQGNGQQTEGWFILGNGRSPQNPGPAVIYFHGNGEIIDECFDYQEIQNYLASGVSVLLPEYRGYGRSQGDPSEKAITKDSRNFYQWLIAKSEVEESKIIFHGKSLGGGVAAALAANYKPAVLILESTFTSIASLSHRYVVPSFLCRHPFRTERRIATLDCPILILHGSQDKVIPVAHGRQLHKLASTSKYIEWEKGHNDPPPDWETYWKSIWLFMSKNNVV